MMSLSWRYCSTCGASSVRDCDTTVIPAPFQATTLAVDVGMVGRRQRDAATPCPGPSLGGAGVLPDDVVVDLDAVGRLDEDAVPVVVVDPVAADDDVVHGAVGPDPPAPGAVELAVLDQQAPDRRDLERRGVVADVEVVHVAVGDPVAAEPPVRAVRAADAQLAAARDGGALDDVAAPALDADRVAARVGQVEVAAREPVHGALPLAADLESAPALRARLVPAGVAGPEALDRDVVGRDPEPALLASGGALERRAVADEPERLRDLDLLPVRARRDDDGRVAAAALTAAWIVVKPGAAVGAAVGAGVGVGVGVGVGRTTASRARPSEADTSRGRGTLELTGTVIEDGTGLP